MGYDVSLKKVKPERLEVLPSDVVLYYCASCITEWSIPKPKAEEPVAPSIKCLYCGSMALLEVEVDKPEKNVRG